MTKKIFLFLTFFVVGCATIPSGYISHSNVDVNNIKIDKKTRKDITFSVNVYSQVGNDVVDMLNTKMIKATKEHFSKTGLFKRIHGVSFKQKSKYHFHFDIKLTGTMQNEQMLRAYLCGMTMALIPVNFDYYLDTTMFIYIDGKEVYSITSPEKIQDIYWLPFIVLSPFLNYLTISDRIIENNMNYFINKIIEEKLY